MKKQKKNKNYTSIFGKITELIIYKRMIVKVCKTISNDNGVKRDSKKT